MVNLQQQLLKILATVFVLSVVPNVFADENLDSLFVEARKAAMEPDQRDQAIALCLHALEVNPDYHDFRILLGRCYSWNGQYDLAETQLSQVVAAVKTYQDARNALIDTYIWSGQHEKALDLLDSTTQMYPTKVDYKLKQLSILKQQSRIPEAIKIADSILALDPGNSKALAFKESVAISKITRSTTLRYDYNRLAETNTEWQFIVLEPSLDPWNWVSIEHKESFSFGPVIFKLNYANRFQKTATQIEVESYPLLRKGTYLYAGIGMSNSELFPSFRMGLDAFQALPRDYEVSLGFRYLKVPDKQIPIYVGSVGKYWQSYWISMKTYISPSNSSLSKSWVFGVRKYLSNPANFVEVNTGSGVSPDTDLGGEELDYLGSRSFGLAFNMQFNPQYDLRLGLQFSNLETRTDAFRGDTGIQLAFTKNY